VPAIDRDPGRRSTSWAGTPRGRIDRQREAKTIASLALRNRHAAVPVLPAWSIDNRSPVCGMNPAGISNHSSSIGIKSGGRAELPFSNRLQVVSLRPQRPAR
jgi:hypothetical protein